MYNPDSMMKKPVAGTDSAYAMSELVGKYVAGLKNDPMVANHTSFYHDYIKRYRTRNVDLEAEFRKLPRSNHTEEIQSQFL